MIVPFIKVKNNTDNYLLKVFDKLEKHPICQSKWGKVQPLPRVSFKIAHTNYSIFLQYDVCENETRAEYSMHNKPIHKDSCVEFFIIFEGELQYFNLEFNCLGACLAAWGTSREKREFLNAEVIDQIEIQTQIHRTGKNGLPKINWKLSLKIPIEIFKNSNISQLSGQRARANFFKCGDKLTNPHYLSWEEINTPLPDFHQPVFFGDLIFL
ncbi:MAG: hypothetical protein JXB00_01120 [Bacteroidales bacterium]|nr:hypothetical protein [Bacteroidales bacterium]